MNDLNPHIYPTNTHSFIQICSFNWFSDKSLDFLTQSGLTIYNLVWIYSVLSAAPVTLPHVCTGPSRMHPDVSRCRLQMVAGRRVKMKTCRVVSLWALGWWCHSMSSLTLFFQIIINRLLRSSSSRLSAAGERRRDILGLSCGRAALPARRRTWCSLTCVCRLTAAAQPPCWVQRKFAVHEAVDRETITSCLVGLQESDWVCKINLFNTKICR